MHLDWDRGHGPVTGPLNAAGAALAAGTAGHAAGLPWPYAAAAAGAGLVGTHISGIHHHLTGARKILHAAAWTVAGAWTSCAVAFGPWTAENIGTLAAAALGFGCAGIGVRGAERKAADERAAQAAAEAQAALDAADRKRATEWEARVLRVTGVSIRIVGIDDWATGGGFTLDAEIAEGGSTWKSIQSKQDGLAADAKLPEGCGVGATPGPHRGAVFIEVATVNFLVEDVDYPADYSPLSTNEPAPMSVRRDGAAYGPVNRQASMFFVGQRGSGKTNLMNVMVANQCRMIDSLTFVIDLNGGGLALKWLRAWHAAGRPGRPPIDWVADTPEKALAMGDALVRIAKARKVGYQDREIAADDDKLPVDEHVPEIRVFNDEGAEIFSSKARTDEKLKRIAGYLIQTIEIARAAAVNVSTSGLRATQDVIADPQILKQSTFKVGLKVADASELNYFFGYGHLASTEDAPYPGCALVRDGDGEAMPVKIYRIKPSQIAEVIKATAHLRPELDELSRQAAGEAYERRWDGTDHLFGLGPAPTQAVADDSGSLAKPATPSGDRRDPTAGWDTEPPATTIQAALDQAQAARDRIRQAADDSVNRDADLDQQFRNVLAGWDTPAKPAKPSGPQPTDGITKDTRWPLVFAIVAGSGPQGINPDAICDLFAQAHRDLSAPSRSAVTEWLKKEPKVYQPTGRTNYAIRPSAD